MSQSPPFIRKSWSEIEDLGEEAYRMYCLQEAAAEVEKMSLLRYLHATLKTLMWMSPVGFIFNNRMFFECYRFAKTALISQSFSAAKQA